MLTALNIQEYNWTEKQVLGMALLLYGGVTDSYGEKIDANVFYEVGKHKENGKVAIIPTDRNQKHEFANEFLKRSNRFN